MLDFYLIDLKSSFFPSVKKWLKVTIII